MAASGHFGSRFLPKSVWTSLYSRSVATSNMKLIGAFLIKLWSAQASHHIFTKWPQAAILVFRLSPKSIGFFHSRASMAVSNMNLIRSYVKHKPWRAAAAVAAADHKHNHNIPEFRNFKFRGYNNICFNLETQVVLPILSRLNNMLCICVGYLSTESDCTLRIQYLTQWYTCLYIAYNRHPTTLSQNSICRSSEWHPVAPSNVKMPLYVKRQLNVKTNINAKCENWRYLWKN